MRALGATGIELAFGDRIVLRGAELNVEEGERIGLVGPNGSGKTSLLRILAGTEAPDNGEVTAVGRRGLLEQVPKLPGETVGEALDAAIAWHAQLLADYEAALAAHDDDLAHTLQGRLDRDGWEVAHQVESIADRVSCPPRSARVDTLSGGERRRVALALALLERPEVLLLDEPTNHLDAETVDWLESFLEGYRGTLILVTHDRYLLERVADRIVEVEDGLLVSYDGSYTDYLLARAERRERLEQADDRRQKMIRQEAAWAARSPAARSTKQKARLQRLDALRNERPLAQESELDLDLRSGKRLGSTILELYGLHKAYAEPLIQDLDLVLAPGDRVGILGPNGIGKTTLLRIVEGTETPDAGQIARGARVTIGTLDQVRSGLDHTATLYEVMGQGNDHVRLGDDFVHVATWLGRFLFRREQFEQRVDGLSGGERARVLLARLLLEQANLLLLDEPTNDLDLMTLRVLEEALLGFDGCALIVSHDRAFIDRVCTRVLAFEGEGRVVTYADRLQAEAARKQRAAAAPQVTEAPKPKPKPKPKAAGARKLSYKETRELEALPARIEALEEELEQLHATLSDPATYQTGADVSALTGRADALPAEIEELYARWEALSERAQ